MKWHPNRQIIVLFLDICSVHPCKMIEKLSNIKLVYLLPSIMSVQPCDQGVIKNLKGHYEKQVMTKIVQQIVSGKMNDVAIDIC